MSSYPSLQGFKALSFDCYGTIIDWESGIKTYLEPLTSRLPPTHKYTTSPTLLLRRLNTLCDIHESTHPTAPYPQILTTSLTTLATEENLTLPAEFFQNFGTSPGTWSPFPDSISALLRLSRYFTLTILSNVDKANISQTTQKLDPVKFANVFTAEEIGSYKPDHRNFDFLFKNVGCEKNELLHVARSLTADHVPAKEMELRSVWISRGGETEDGQGVGGDLEGLREKVGFEWRFDDLGAFADEVERQLGKGE